MLQTIVTAGHISVQGEFVRRTEDGKVMVRVGETYYVGRPVEQVETTQVAAGMPATA